jgi:hypothetical protein
LKHHIPKKEFSYIGKLIYSKDPTQIPYKPGTPMNDNHKQPYTYRVSNYVKSHKVSLALFLAAYGAFYLSSVILSGWTLADWGKDLTSYPPSSISALMPRSVIDPLFFVTSFPALIIGAVMLCAYSIRGINPAAVDDREHVAILLTVFGFAYQVIGAWPLGGKIDFPWEWQKQIVSNGTIFAWTLYVLSLSVLVVGGISLYIHSRIYHQKHPEMFLEK